MKNKKVQDFKVSVVIPVYNAAKYLNKAIDSVISQDEVGEVLLIDDQSKDNSLKICIEYQNKYEHVHAFTHPKNEHKGASACRNLGILKSKFDFIAFLDAEDYYLPGRFEEDKKIFSQYPKADVVYSSVKQEGQENASMLNTSLKDVREEIGIDASPQEFYKYSITVKQRHPAFHKNSVTIRRNFLLQGKLFDQRLSKHEDSELWKRLLRIGNFYSGKLNEPVAILRKHSKKRESFKPGESRLEMYAVFLDNVGVENLYGFERDYVIDGILRSQGKSISNPWKRRISYYTRKFIFQLQKEKFLENFSSNFLEEKINSN